MFINVLFSLINLFIGIPSMGVAPFDPHFAEEVLQTRSVGGLGYKLTLRNVYERGWSQSTVTKYKLISI